MSTKEAEPTNNYSSTYHAKFLVLMILEIPSILISLLIFIYFGADYRTRIKRQNHSILLLLFINFIHVVTVLPMHISYYHLNGVVQPATSAYCTWWVWYDFSINTINGFLMAWISIERHLLIFHSNSIQNLARWKRRMLHIGPLVICSLYGPMFYLLAIVISPLCINQWRYDIYLCGLPCYLPTGLGVFDIFFGVVTPVFIIFLCNLVLVVRVIYQKATAVGRVGNNNRGHYKMAFQLGLISLVYLVVWLPLATIQFVQAYINPAFLLDYSDMAGFLVSVAPSVFPIIYLISLAELWEKIRDVICPRRNAVVRPMNTVRSPKNNIQQLARTIIQTRV